MVSNNNLKEFIKMLYGGGLLKQAQGASQGNPQVSGKYNPQKYRYSEKVFKDLVARIHKISNNPNDFPKLGKFTFPELVNFVKTDYDKKLKDTLLALTGSFTTYNERRNKGLNPLDKKKNTLQEYVGSFKNRSGINPNTPSRNQNTLGRNPQRASKQALQDIYTRLKKPKNVGISDSLSKLYNYKKRAYEGRYDRSFTPKTPPRTKQVPTYTGSVANSNTVNNMGITKDQAKATADKFGLSGAKRKKYLSRFASNLS